MKSFTCLETHNVLRTMKQYSVSCRIVLNHVDQWVYLSGVHVDLSARLEPRRFAPFDYRLDFAGRSAGGLCLSVRGSAGPARIGPYPLLESLPPGWVAFSAPVPGLLLRTDRPRL